MSDLGSDLENSGLSSRPEFFPKRSGYPFNITNRGIDSQNHLTIYLFGIVCKTSRYHLDGIEILHNSLTARRDVFWLPETAGNWKFLELSGQFSRYNIFQGDSFFSPGFRFKIFHHKFPTTIFFAHFRLKKIIFRTNFLATIFSPDAHFFNPFSDLESSARKFQLQFFNFFSVMHFVFYLFFK